MFGGAASTAAHAAARTAAYPRRDSCLANCMSEMRALLLRRSGGAPSAQMAALALAALALALAERPPEESPPPPVPQCGGYLILNGVGLTGGAGKKTANNVSSVAACCQICRQSSCAAWTYHPAGGHSSEQCNTVARPGAQHQSNGAVSGCVPGPSNAACAAPPSPAPGPGPGPGPSPPHRPPHIPSVPAPLPPGAPPRPPLGFQPNIVMVLTDDQDVELGGMEPMPQARKLLGEARPEQSFASRSVRRARLMPKVYPGSLYRCGKGT